MLVVPDITKKFSIQEVPYLDLSVTDLFEFMLSVKKVNSPNWTDESTSDIGIQIIWMFAILSDWMIKHIERAKDNCFIGTATSRESLRRLTELIGYTLLEAQPASVLLDLTHTGSHGAFTIDKGTKFSTKSTSIIDPIIFESNADENIGVDQTSSTIQCTQGKTVTEQVIGSSAGKINEEYTIEAISIVWQSEVIEVYTGSVWETWTRVDNFVDSTDTDQHYRIEIQNDNDYVIVFGDGVNGILPISGISNVRATYKVSVGQLGNVAKDTITEFVVTIPNTTAVTNVKAASGAVDRETLDHARLHSTANVRTLDRAVTSEDVETLSKDFDSSVFGKIAVAKTIPVGSQALQVMIVPASGGLPVAGHKVALQTYIADRLVMGLIVQVIDPKYSVLDVTATIVAFPDFTSSQLANVVSDRLSNLISPTFVDPETGLYPHEFGRDIRISDIYALIDNTEGVDYVSILASPTSDHIVKLDEIANVGTITITVVAPDGEFTYANVKSDIIKRFQQRLVTNKQRKAI